MNLISPFDCHLLGCCRMDSFWVNRGGRHSAGLRHDSRCETQKTISHSFKPSPNSIGIPKSFAGQSGNPDARVMTGIRDEQAESQQTFSRHQKPSSLSLRCFFPGHSPLLFGSFNCHQSTCLFRAFFTEFQCSFLSP